MPWPRPNRWPSTRPETGSAHALPGRPDLCPAHEGRWLLELARAIAAVHDTSVDHTPCLARTISYPSPYGDDGADPRRHAIAAAIDELRLVAADQPQVFSHRDYHPGNVLFDGKTLVGVVDWMDAGHEPRESAVAYCRKDLAIHPGGDAPDRFLAAYEAETGYRLDVRLWDVLHGSGARRWGHLWVPSFAELGVSLTAEHIARASDDFVHHALGRRR